MTNNNDDHPSQGQQWPRSEPDTPEFGERREPSFGQLDDEGLEGYEEPDRDTDFGYGADEVTEEEEFDDLFPDQDSDDPEEPGTGQTAINPFSSPGPEESEEPATEASEDLQDWSEEEDEYYEEEEGDRAWPLKLVAVAAVAVVLVAAGVYGVLQERAATQAELLELRATLATSVTQSDVRANRDTLQELQQSYDALSAQADTLSLENTQLRDTIFDLETQLKAVAKEKEAQEPAPKPAVKKPAPQAAKPAPAPAPTSAPAPTGRWFVNFGSYSSRKLADSWAARLRPAKGEVIVMPGTKDNKTFYRVRVVGLDGKSSADLVARQLEAEQQVSKLWVGQD